YAILEEQTRRLGETASGRLGFGLLFSFLLAVWSSSRAVDALITALNVAYEEDEARGFIHRTLVAIGLTLGGLCFFALSITAIAAVSRPTPCRADARFRWLPPGAVVAALLWLASSLLFSFYVANFASYNETFGSIGAVVVLLLWFYISAFAVCIGAELNAELE